MSKQKQVVTAAASPAVDVQAKKLYKKKRKAEPAQNGQVPAKVKKQKKSKAAAPVKGKSKKKKKLVAESTEPAISTASVLLSESAPVLTPAEKPKKKKKSRASDISSTAPVVPAAASEAPAGADAVNSIKKSKGAKAAVAELEPVAAASLAEPHLEKQKKKKKPKTEVAPQSAAAALKSEPVAEAATAAVDGKKKSSKKRKRASEGDQAAAVVTANGDVLPSISVHANAADANADGNDVSAVKPIKKKSKKGAVASEAASEAAAMMTDAPNGVVVPAVIVSPDVVVLPAASVEAALGDKKGEFEAGRAVAVKGPPGARAFKRVNDDEWLGKKGAWDNSYEAKFGTSGWGAKASQTLLQVRGKDFRHEKTKKKRGSYKGGLIDNNVNSFKFESDDE